MRRRHRCWRASTSRSATRRGSSARCRRASASWWPWPRRSATSRGCSCSTSRQRRWAWSRPAHVEQLITNLRRRGITILLASRDIEQMFRLADRILVLRRGSVVAEVDPRGTHPDDLAALLSGQQVDSSARRQLTRLHGLADRLVSADPSSSLSLILSALGAALASDKVCIHVVSDRSLICAAALGFAPGQIAGWSKLAVGPTGGPVGRAAAGGQRVVEADLRATDAWEAFGGITSSAEIAGSWSIPVTGPAGVSAVITVFRPRPRRSGPRRARSADPLCRICRQRRRTRPSARAGHLAQPGAGDDPRDAGDTGRAGDGRPGSGHRAAIPAPWPAIRRGGAADPR